MNEVIVGAAYIGRFLREVGADRVELFAQERSPRAGRIVERVDDYLLFRPDDPEFFADPCCEVEIQGRAGAERFSFRTGIEGQDEDGRLILRLPERIEKHQARQGERAPGHAGLLLRVGVDGELVDLDLVDLGENGLAFTSEDLDLRVGMRLAGHLELEENSWVPVTLEVRHIRGDGVVGAEVVDISLSGKHELLRLAKGLPAKPLPVVSFGFKEDG